LVLGLGACPFSQTFAPDAQLAGLSKEQTHSLALKGSPLDRSHRELAYLGSAARWIDYMSDNPDDEQT
jgi:hypothetical protein